MSENSIRIIVAVVGGIAAIYLLSPGKAHEVENGKVLRASWRLRSLFIFPAGVLYLLCGQSLLSANEEAVWYLPGSLVLICTVFSIVIYYLLAASIENTEDGLSSYLFPMQPRFIAWSDIREKGYSSFFGMYRVTGKDGVTIRWSEYLDGARDLSSTIDQWLEDKGRD